jgi:hypothetical protein
MWLLKRQGAASIERVQKAGRRRDLLDKVHEHEKSWQSGKPRLVALTPLLMAVEGVGIARLGSFGTGPAIADGRLVTLL